MAKVKLTKVQLRLKKKRKAYQKSARRKPGSKPPGPDIQVRPKQPTLQPHPRVITELLPAAHTVGMSLHTPKVINRV